MRRCAKSVCPIAICSGTARTTSPSDGDELIGVSVGWSGRDKLYSPASDDAGDSRLLDPATESADIRAMFVGPTGGRLATQPSDHRGSQSFAREAGTLRHAMSLMAIASR